MFAEQVKILTSEVIFFLFKIFGKIKETREMVDLDEFSSPLKEFLT